jgi:hypothetical protein
MKKLFTLLTLLLCVASSAWADEAIISWNMGVNGAAASGANSITGATGCAAEGFTIAITGNTGKSWSNGNGDITYNSTTYKTLKNSNGAQNTITCPAGKVATQVVFYVTSNADSSGKLTEFDGTTCSDEVNSCRDYEHPTIITKTIDNKPSFTFTFSTKQVCFIAVVTYTDAASDVVANPVITQTGTSVAMTCNTSGAKVYYTIDGAEPTVNSTLYSEAITLDNSCSVRAKAFNGDQNQYSSEAVKKDCFIDHSSAEGFVTKLGYDGGTVTGDVWTSNDNYFVLTNNVAGRGINYAGLSSGQDGFKLNHTDYYTISAPDVKITKIVVVGKSWLQGEAGNASNIKFDGFTPENGTFFDYPTNGETYVKTIEFTPESELDYGATITMRPGKNQLGAYIEVYGVKRSGPADPTPVAGKTVTWDFSSETAQAAAGTITPNYSNTLTATDGSSIITYVAGDNDKYETSYLKPGGKSGTNSGIYTNRYFILNITKSGTISFVGANTSTKSGNYVILQGSSDDVADAVEKGTVANTASNCSYSVNVQDGEYVFVAFSSQIYTASVSWAENSDDIELTTTSTMQGWRSFYDANNSYTVDKNTKVYVATQENDGKVTLTEYAAGVPAGTPVILKTSAEAENDGTFKMTLTKTTETITPTYEGESLLKVTPFEGNVYRLGSKNGEVGFFPFNATGAVAGIVVLNIDSSNAGARGLTITFVDDETTAIHNVNDNVNLNKVVFDLQGRRVLEPGKGLYIVNGKKVVIK